MNDKRIEKLERDIARLDGKLHRPYAQIAVMLEDCNAFSRLLRAIDEAKGLAEERLAQIAKLQESANQRLAEHRALKAEVAEVWAWVSDSSGMTRRDFQAWKAWHSPGQPRSEGKEGAS